MDYDLLEKLTNCNDSQKLIAFGKKCTDKLLDRQLFKQTTYHIDHVELSLDTMISICRIYLAVTTSVCERERILNRIERIDNIKSKFINNKLVINEKNKIMVECLFREYYQLCQHYHWDSRRLEQVKNQCYAGHYKEANCTIQEINIFNENSLERILKYGTFYAKKVLNRNLSGKVFRTMNTYEYKLLLFFTNHSTDKIIEFLKVEYPYIELKELFDFLPIFLKNYSIVEGVEDITVINSISDKLKRLLENTIPRELSKLKEEKKDYLKNLKEEKILVQQEKLKVAKYYCNEYMTGNYLTADEFCKAYGLELEVFKSYTRILLQFDKKLYKKIVDKMSRQSSEFITYVIENLILCIKNGILLDDGSSREFDLIDYYLTFKVSINKIRQKLNSMVLPEEDLALVRSFIGKFRIKPITEYSIYNETVTQMINGKPYTVSETDKMVIINFLAKNDIPLSTTTYSIYLKRYLKEKSNLNDEKVKIYTI